MAEVELSERARAHLDEQARIIAVGEAVLDELRELVDAKERELSRIKQQRDALVAHLSSGDTND